MSKTETSTQLQHVPTDKAVAIKIGIQNPEEPEIITKQNFVDIDKTVNLNDKVLAKDNCENLNI
jgi:hypothetical protein